MTNARNKALTAYRRRLKRRGLMRLEVHVTRRDAALVRDLAKALNEPARAAKTRALLKTGHLAGRPQNLKALLAAAPLEGIDLVRERYGARDIDF